MNGYWTEERSIESVQAECRRLEAIGYKIMYYVKPTKYDRRMFWWISPFNVGCLDFLRPGIRALR